MMDMMVYPLVIRAGSYPNSQAGIYEANVKYLVVKTVISHSSNARRD